MFPIDPGIRSPLGRAFGFDAAVSALVCICRPGSRSSVRLLYDDLRMRMSSDYNIVAFLHYGMHVRNESIAAAGQGQDVATVLRGVTKGLANNKDVLAQVAFF